MRACLLPLCAAMALAGCQAEQQRAAPPPPEQSAQVALHPISGLRLLPLRIVSERRSHDFTVELAATEEQQSQGLMFRNSLGPDEGMIFPHSPPRPASFWMRNTYIPLDLIFIRADGTIARIAANAVPHSLDSVASGEPVAAVLEIAGGRAAELGIREGARVSWPGGPAG